MKLVLYENPAGWGMGGRAGTRAKVACTPQPPRHCAHVISEPTRDGVGCGEMIPATLLGHGAKINSQFISPCIPVAVHKHFLVSPTHCRKNLTA